MPSLSDFAKQFSIDTARPYFPVNSLRLLYFMIADSFVANNKDLIDQIGRAIPLVEAITSNKNSEAIKNIMAAVPSPKMHNAVEHFHATLLPFQTDVLATLYRDFTQDGPLNESHLKLLLRTRAMDSYLYAIMVSELIQKYAKLDEEKALKLSSELESEFNTLYQLNDLIDSVVYAKDDIEADNFSPLQMMRKIAPQPQDTKDLIQSMQENLSSAIKNESIKMFQLELVDLLK